MNCKKCGYPLVSGQTICSNCDEYNEREMGVNNFQTSVSNETNNVVNYDTNSYNEYSDIEIEKKPFPKWIIFIVIAMVVIPVSILGIILVISTTSVSSTISKEKYNSFFATYKMLHKEVLMNSVSNELCICDGDCSLIYDYNEDDINFYVEDKGSYYEIIYEAKEYGRYGKINLKSKDCENITDATCDKRVITGKVYKD